MKVLQIFNGLILIIVFSIFVTSCTTTNVQSFYPSSKDTICRIEKIVLSDDNIIVFNEKGGKYDSEKNAITGETINGIRIQKNTNEIQKAYDDFSILLNNKAKITETIMKTGEDVKFVDNTTDYNIFSRTISGVVKSVDYPTRPDKYSFNDLKVDLMRTNFPLYEQAAIKLKDINEIKYKETSISFLGYLGLIIGVILLIMVKAKYPDSSDNSNTE